MTWEEPARGAMIVGDATEIGNFYFTEHPRTFTGPEGLEVCLREGHQWDHRMGAMLPEGFAFCPRCSATTHPHIVFTRDWGAFGQLTFLDRLPRVRMGVQL